MDNLTHGLLGYAVQAMGRRPEENQDTQKAILWGSLLGAEAPDIDMVTAFLGPAESLELHRGITHSLPGVLVLSGLIYLGLKWAFPRMEARRVFLLTFLSGIIHIVADLLTSYGTRILIPWSNRMYATDTLFIIDLVIILALLAGIGLQKVGINRVKAFRAVGLFLVLYIGSRAYIHVGLVERVEQAYPERQSISVLPTPISLSNWRYIVEREGEMVVGQVNYFRGTIQEEKRLASNIDHPVVEAAKQAPNAQIFLNFARYVYADYEKQGDRFVVNLYDPRFSLQKRPVFGSQVVLDSNLQILSDRLNSH